MTKRQFDPKIFLSHVTTMPGVYQMRDENGKVLYVGKAKNLRQRLSSYFRQAGMSAKTQALMKQVIDIETTATQTETEALILENNLIKTHQPKFNILLRDDKSYPYIRLSDHAFPRLSLHRGARKNGEFFGPYPNVQAVRYSLDLLEKVFRVRQCEDSFFAGRSRPCLQYQIKRCFAPCVGKISAADYAQTVEHTRDFLTGKSEAVIETLQQNMAEAAENLQFEQAAIFRDQLAQLRKITEKQHMITGDSDADVLAVATAYGEACVHVLFYRHGHNITSQAFYPKLPEQTPPADILSAFIGQFYAQRPPPTLLILNEAIEDPITMAHFLSEKIGQKVQIQASPRGEKRKWLAMAEENARLNLSLRLSGKLTMNQRFQALAEAFGWKKTPERLECIDISHTQGADTVASCVVFDQRGAVKSEYRRYNMKGITAGDDYAAIRQTVERRFSRVVKEAGILPDVLFIDGGRGQLKQAVEVFAALKITGVKLIGVAKGEGRKAGLEKFFFPQESRPRYLPADSQAMQLIVQIRDEAHRFAITGHRASRGKSSQRSRLEQIPGVGIKRRQALLKYFGGLAAVQQAGVEDLTQVTGISEALAKEIYAAFHE